MEQRTPSDLEGSDWSAMNTNRTTLDESNRVMSPWAFMGNVKERRDGKTVRPPLCSTTARTSSMCRSFCTVWKLSLRTSCA